MSIDFFEAKCQSSTDKKIFGLRDDPAPAKNPAYIDELSGKDWIAVVVNENRHEIIFTAIDNCIEIKRKDGNMAQRCEGFLTYGTTIVFVELKERSTKGVDWIKEAEQQLRVSIHHFEDTKAADRYKRKKAYIANNEHPKFKASQMDRMNRFYADTRYVLRIENRIVLE